MPQRATASDAGRVLEWIPSDDRWRILGGGTTAALRDRDRRDFVEAVGRLLVLHRLKVSGALTYDEFTVLKARLLDL
jgi:hypothetical protein